MFTKNAVFTDAGRNLLARVHNGTGRLKITRAEMGDGTLGSQNPEKLTELLSPVVNKVAPLGVSVPLNARVTVRFDSNTVDIPKDFWWREWGIFAQNPETGEEVLYAYNNAGDKADYVTAGSGNTIILAQTIYIGTATTVNVIIDPSVAYALEEEFLAHVADTANPHDVTPEQIGGLGVDGNAASATKLQTARVIGHAPFDGTAGISVQQIGLYTFGHYVTIPALAAGGQTDVSVDLSALPDNVKAWVNPYKPILFIGRQTSGPVAFNWGAANPDIVNWTVSVTIKNITTATTYGGAYSFYVVVFGG